MVKTRDEAIKIANDYVQFIKKVFFIKEVYLFGSFADEHPQIHKWSDIDLAIVSPDFGLIPIDMASKFLSKATEHISTQIEPIPLPESEVIDPEIGTIGYTVLKKGIQIYPSQSHF